MSKAADSLRDIVEINLITMRISCSFPNDVDCKGAWCRHRSDYINQRLDSDEIFDEFISDDGNISLNNIDILAPVRPTIDKWAPVRLSAVAVDILSVTDPNDSTIFYGVIRRSQGLRDVRDLWFDRMEQLVELDGVGTEEDRKLLPCTGKHGWKSMMAEKPARANKDQANLYNIEVMLTGKCPTCSRVENFSNYEDMIPSLTQSTTAWQRQQMRANGGQISNWQSQQATHIKWPVTGDPDPDAWTQTPF